jgi:AcrR family transcriptional regulator
MPPRSRTPISRRERPAKPALTRQGIVSTAVAILREEGLAKVTMRRLAQELDTGPASLYVYVANTDELHSAMLDELLGDVDLDAAAGGHDWLDQLVDVLTSYTAVLVAHPELARAALVSQPSGDHYLRLVERLLSLLDEGGVPPQQAAWGVDVVLQSATAQAVEVTTRAESPHARDEWDAMTRALHGVDERTHPRLHALADRLLSGTPQQRLSWRFRMLVNGIAGTPVPDESPGGVPAC